MAWTATDNFDSYTATADLDTLNGGTSWSGAWAKSGTGAMTIETAPAGGQGGNAVRSQSAATANYRRVMTGITAGTLSFRMRISITNPNATVGVFPQSATGAIDMGGIRFGPTGNFEIFNVSAYDSLSITYSVDTWYTVDIDFDDAVQTSSYRARINGGTYSAYKPFANTLSSNPIDTVSLSDNATNAHTAWFDAIGPVSAGPPPETRTITMVRGG